MEQYTCIGGLINNICEHYCIFGDSAYLCRSWLQQLFMHGLCCIEEKAFNASMSAVRVTIGYSYKETKQFWNRQDSARM